MFRSLLRRALTSRERAELEWWRHFRIKCGAGFPVRVGEVLGGRQFVVSERRLVSSGGICTPVPVEFDHLRPVPPPPFNPDESAVDWQRWRDR